MKLSGGCRLGIDKHDVLWIAAWRVYWEEDDRFFPNFQLRVHGSALLGAAFRTKWPRSIEAPSFRTITSLSDSHTVTGPCMSYHGTL